MIGGVFALAGWTPQPTVNSEADLLCVEARLGRHLPAEFRRFYALENGLALMARFSNGDSPIERRELGLPLRGDTAHNPLKDSFLPFMIENQEVCVWAIHLGHEDDPAVFVNYDERWSLCCDRFTTWLNCRVWDSLLLDSCAVAAIGPPLGVEKLRRLRERFSEGNQTYGWPGKAHYRFSDARSQLLLWDSEGQCDWWFATSSDGDARTALHEIEGIAGVDTVFSWVKKESAQR